MMPIHVVDPRVCFRMEIAISCAPHHDGCFTPSLAVLDGWLFFLTVLLLVCLFVLLLLMEKKRSLQDHVLFFPNRSEKKAVTYKLIHAKHAKLSTR